MQQTKSSVSPRGWAMLTLVGGAALASPFLRPPRVDVDEVVSESPLSHGVAPGRLASLESSLGWPAEATAAGSESHAQSESDFSTQITPAVVSSPAELPAWAQTGSPIDQVISRGTAPPWHNTTANRSSIQQLDPWINPSSNSDSPRAFPSTAPSTVTAGNWPEANAMRAVPMVEESKHPSRSPGSLTGSSLSGSQSPRARLQRQGSTGVTPPANPPKYVFQPGFSPQEK